MVNSLNCLSQNIKWYHIKQGRSHLDGQQGNTRLQWADEYFNFLKQEVKGMALIESYKEVLLGYIPGKSCMKPDKEKFRLLAETIR